MSKATDKLSKLANFGASAGAKPAASAHAAVASLDQKATEQPSGTPSVETGSLAPTPVVEPKVAKRESAVPKNKQPVKIERKPLVRNVIFTNEDQIELERLEAAMRQAGIIRPSIADIVRIALRTAKPSPEEASEVFRDTKLLDGRTFEGKRLRLGGRP
jgi:hypothetical protein